MGFICQAFPQISFEKVLPLRSAGIFVFDVARSVETSFVDDREAFIVAGLKWRVFVGETVGLVGFDFVDRMALFKKAD